jgi:hypothetical protein
MLSAGERHGYGIRQDIIDHTSGTIALEAATSIAPFVGSSPMD